jgi:hypothetical protein
MANALKNISKSGNPGPARNIIYGPPGVGKTTCSSLAFKPIGIGTEDGWGFSDVDHFPKPNSYADISEQLKTLMVEEHGYRTLIVDSLDGVEKLIERAICEKHGHQFMSDFPFYRGNVEAVGWIENLLHDLDDLRRLKNMQLIVISHAARVTVEDPTLGAYDRMEPNLYKKSVPLFVAWADNVGYMDFQRIADSKKTRDSKKTVPTAKTTGVRIMKFVDNGSFIAKNRRGLPSEIEIEADKGWSVVEEAMKAAQKGAKE